MLGLPAARLGDGASELVVEEPAEAQPARLSEAGFQAYLPSLRAAVAARRDQPRDPGSRLSQPDLLAAHRRARPRPARRPARLDRRFPPSLPIARAISARSLINRGRARYSENLSRLNEIGRRYGVPPSVLVAIWGKETSYGTITGDFDLLNSLASLAYEGRRRDLFAGEFIATLKMMDRGFPRSELVGSWAGATGQSQFLPSVYIRLGVDGDGDGRADIWRSQLDALASIANYLRNAGWRPGLPWGVGGAGAGRLRPRRGRQPDARAALPARPRAPQPLADRRRVAPPRHRQQPARQCDGVSARAGRAAARPPICSPPIIARSSTIIARTSTH